MTPANINAALKNPTFNSGVDFPVPDCFCHTVNCDIPILYIGGVLDYFRTTVTPEFPQCLTSGLALDCGPGWTFPDAKKFARAMEPFNLLWAEDLLTGDYSPFVNADVYRDLTTSTTTPIHTGEQIYLRQNFKTLIEGHARLWTPDASASQAEATA